MTTGAGGHATLHHDPDISGPSFLSRQLTRFGVPFAIVATFAVFSILRPDSFFTELTIKGILRDCVPLMIVGLGITVVLAMNDYDLSVGGMISLCATTVVLLLSSEHAGLHYARLPRLRRQA
ncbi:MAG: ABC transporter permease [Actinobacteria bacterium]|nr:ABC transporter permease [Actinomycetota bacterium]